MPQPLAPWRAVVPVAIALTIGAAGGGAFSYLMLPLPWMLGALACVTPAALAGANVRVPTTLRNCFITILGVMLGSQFSFELLSRLGQWATSLTALALWMITVTIVGAAYMRVAARHDPVTAFFSATPGGLTEMLLIGGQMGGDERVISLTHAARLVVVVFSIPLWYRLGSNIPSASVPSIAAADLAVSDVVLLAACAVAGALLARRLRLPAANLIGPMVLSAAVHLTGLTTSKPPDAIVALAQLVIGTTVGCRFAGVKLSAIAHVLKHALITAVLMLGMTLLFALAVARLTSIPIPALVLSFAPGGLAEMSLIALGLGLDAAFVAVHHIFRILFVVIVAPVAFRLTGWRASGPHDRS